MAVNVLNIGNVTLPGKGYLPMSAFNIPDTVGLDGCWLFGEGVDLAPKNYAPGKPDASLVGSIVDGTGYVRLPNLSYLQTEVAETAEMTYLIIARKSPTVTGQVAFIGNFSSNTEVGVSIYSGTGLTAVSANVGRDNADPSSTQIASDPSDWGLYTLEVPPPDGNMRLRNFTNGATSASTNVGNRLIAGGGKIRIGRLYASGYADSIDVAVAMSFSRYISLEDMTETRNWARAYAAQFGITV